MNKLFAKVLNIGKVVKESPFARKALSSALALTVVLTPLSPAIAVSADEIAQENEAVEETVVETETTIHETEVAVPVETTVVPDYSEYATEETTTVIVEDEDLVTSDPTEEIDTTAPPMEQETTVETAQTEPEVTETTVAETEPEIVVEEKTCNIVFAKSADEYYKLISSLPDGYQRVIVDTYADLSNLDGANGVYYDGTYILVFNDSDSYTNAVKVIHDKGYEYAIDGTLSVCGNIDGVISYGSINPSAKIKVAVIDTGSNLANEKYSVIGDNVADHNGHGTAMSSLILDETSNAYIVSIKALDDNGHGNMSDVYAAVQLAEDLGIDYILMAVSIRNSGKYDAFISLIKDTKATVVAAAGNNGTDASKYLPAGIDGVITVGAVDDEYYLRSFSNYGTCVEYYEIADSTSEASAKILGKIISGQALNTIAYITDDHWYEEGSEYYFDTDAYFPNANEWVDVDANLVGTTYLYTYSETSGSTDGHFHTTLSDYSNIAYCVQVDKVNPWSTHYHDVYASYGNDEWTSGSVSGAATFQAAMACGPGGNLYQESLLWWKNYLSNHSSVLSGYTYKYGRNTTISSGTTFSPSISNFDIDHATANEHYFMYLVTHLCADWALSSSSSKPYDVTGPFGKAIDDYYYNFLKAARKGDFSQLNLDYEITTTDWWGTVYYNSEGSTTYQHIGRGNVTVNRDRYSEISLTKTSSEPFVTGGNSCYSLEGASYGLYSDSSCTNKIATFTVDASGKATSTYTTKTSKTYYLKEITAGKGYFLDTTTYTVTVATNGTVSVNNGATTVVSGDVTYIKVTDRPGNDPFWFTLRKIDKNGNIVQNAELTGAVFRIYYYAQDLGTSGNNDATATVIYEVTLNSSSATVSLDMLRGLNPVGGSNQNYFKNLPNDWLNFPFGTIRIQEVKAPVGYRINDQIVRYRLLPDSTTYYLESSSVYGNRNYWKHQQDGSWDLTELPKVGYYSLTKSLDDTAIRSSLAGFKYELYNTSSQSSPVQIATGISQSDGRVLWTYTVTNYYKNTDISVLLTGTTTYELELPATEKNASGTEVAIQYEVREIKSSIAIAYGNTGIPFTYSVPLTDGKAWSNAADYYYKAVTVSNDSVKREGIVNNYEFTGLNVKKVVPANNPFDTTKVSFKLYNTEGGKDTLVANGTVDSKGNVTWYRVIFSGYGSTPSSSVNVINYLPLGHYRIEETWNKSYVDASGVSILIEEKNNSGWAKNETDTYYTYSYNIDLSAKSNDEKVAVISVENEREVQEFNLAKVVTVAGDSSKIKAELYLVVNNQSILISTGTCITNGVGTYGFTWDYTGTHTDRDGLDTLVLPVGKYRVIEYCPETYYKETKVPYTYMTPTGFTSTTVNGNLQFYKDFELKSGSYTTLKSSVTNVRIEASFDIIKVEHSGDGKNKSFSFEIYYRGNGETASDTATLIEKVTITTVNGKGTASLFKLPEGWYEIREVGTDSKWISHWANPDTVINGNKLIHLSSVNRTIAAPTVNDSVKENGNSVNAVLIYNDVTPEIQTTLIDRGTEDHITTCSETAELVDIVSYKNLKPGHYVMSGILQDKNTGEALLDKDGNEIVGITEFDVPEVRDEYGYAIPQSGTVEVIFIIDTTRIEGAVIVAFEEMHKETITGSLETEHKDINSVEQTVVVPSIKTTAIDSDNGSHTLTYKERVNITDKVTYTGLIVGKTYIAEGTLYDVATGEIYEDNEGKTYTASQEFTATEADGFVYVEFKDVLIPYEKTTIVVFENVSDKEKGVRVAVHASLTDENQTVERGTAKTVATIDGAKAIWLGSTEVRNITITDTITYTGFEVGSTYRAVATLYKTDGTQLTSAGQPIISMVEFVPASKAGTVDVNITFSTEGLSEGDKIVVFEKIYDVATEIEITEGIQVEDLLIARHEEFVENQMITIHFRPSTGEITPIYIKIGAALLALSTFVASIIIRRKKKLLPPTT